MKPSICGFTLVELLVVIVIIGVIAGIITPSLKNGYASLEFRNAVTRLTSAIQLTRSKALRERVAYKIDIDNAGYHIRRDAIAAPDAENHAFPETIIVRCLKTPLVIYPDGAIDDNVVSLQYGNESFSITTVNNVVILTTATLSATPQ